MAELEDTTLGSGLKLGQKYIDPGSSGQVDTSKPHYILAPFNEHRAALERAAYPWRHTPEVAQARREAQEEQMFNAMFDAVRGLSA